MSNWFLAFARWVVDRFSRLYLSNQAKAHSPGRHRSGLSRASVDPSNADSTRASSANASSLDTPASRAAEPISFQASALRQSRPLASSLTRQSVTIAIPHSAQKQHEAHLATQNEEIVEPESEITAFEAEQDNVVENTVAEGDLTEGDVNEGDVAEPAITDIEISDAETSTPDTSTPDTSTPDVAESDVLDLLASAADSNEESPNLQSPNLESTISDLSAPPAAQALAEMAAIQATQSEAIFTVRNAEDGRIDVQVRGETMPLGAALESLLFVADTSVEVTQFVKLFSLDAEVIEAELAKLNDYYKQSARGIRLQEQNGHYRLISLPAAANLIETFLNLDLTTRLSGPALETLSVIAYRQPATRAQIEAVRGVDCGYVLRSLLQRGLIEESGRLETVGRPILYSVTELFMQHFGLTTLNDLPPLETTEAALLMQVTEMEEEGG